MQKNSTKAQEDIDHAGSSVAILEAEKVNFHRNNQEKRRGVDTRPNFFSADVDLGEEDNSRYGRKRVKPLAYWSSERLAETEGGMVRIEQGSHQGDLLLNPLTTSPTLLHTKKKGKQNGQGHEVSVPEVNVEPVFREQQTAPKLGDVVEDADHGLVSAAKQGPTSSAAHENLCSTGSDSQKVSLASIAAAAGAQAAKQDNVTKKISKKKDANVREETADNEGKLKEVEMGREAPGQFVQDPEINHEDAINTKNTMEERNCSNISVHNAASPTMQATPVLQLPQGSSLQDMHEAAGEFTNPATVISDIYEITPNNNQGTPFPSVPGVPEHLVMQLASTPEAERPRRCGHCKACLNPARKKACETIRALGTNPPIPRGKNRIALLGEETAKRTVKKSALRPDHVVPSVSTPTSGGLTVMPAQPVAEINETPKNTNSGKKQASEKKKRTPVEKKKKIVTSPLNPSTAEDKSTKKTAPDRRRAHRCGTCKSCLNPARKKACEALRAAGANPPIPRGKNRIELLGEEGARQTVKRGIVADIMGEGQRVLEGRSADFKTRLSKRTHDQSVDQHQEAATPEQQLWTDEQVRALHWGWLELSPNTTNFWQKIAARVPGKSASDCFAKIYERYPTPKNKKKTAKRTAAEMEAGSSVPQMGPRAKKSSVQTAARKHARQKREAGKKSKEEAEEDDILHDDQRGKYIDQILKQRKGRAVGDISKIVQQSTAGPLEKPPKRRDIDSKISNIQAAIAAHRQQQDVQEDNDTSSDYYWSDAE